MSAKGQNRARSAGGGDAGFPCPHGCGFRCVDWEVRTHHIATHSAAPAPGPAQPGREPAILSELHPADMPTFGKGPDTPLPPTNATIHVLKSEDGYGTRERQFNALCGVSWKAADSTGDHKYFHREETHWHKHVNCQACLTRLQSTGGAGK